ncbi:MAG: hypothetical protein ACJ76N_13660 [Thermoanaerobaculia bacterium]
MRAAYRAVLRGNRLEWRDKTELGQNIEKKNADGVAFPEAEFMKTLSGGLKRKAVKGLTKLLGVIGGIFLGLSLSSLAFLIQNGKFDRNRAFIIAIAGFLGGFLIAIDLNADLPQSILPRWWKRKHTFSTPQDLSPDHAIEVSVTILGTSDSPAIVPARGAAMAAALERLAAAGGPRSFGDAAGWERDAREDRILPGREP